MANYTLKLKRAQAGKLPSSPGVYFFKKGGEILYIGKAANLRERVKSHFQQPSYRDNFFIGKVRKIGYMATYSEIEALILEAKLIKKRKPRYNVLWRDDKNYFYVAITKEKLPRVFITHQMQKVNIKNQNERLKFKINYLGPFVDGIALKKTLRFLRKVFPYYTIKKHPKKLCPWCRLSLCPGPAPNPKNYQKSIKNLVKVLKGGRKSVWRRLKKEMLKASQKQSFEKAGKIRDQITALQKVVAHAKIIRAEETLSADTPYNRVEAYDISNIQGKFAAGAMVVFTKGKPDKTQYRKFKIRWSKTPNDLAMIGEVLKRRFRHAEWPLPDLILVDGGKAQLNAAKIVAKHFKVKADIIALTKDSRHKGVKIYAQNKKGPTQLSKLSEAFRNLLLRINSEAHRFSISYYRHLHRKTIAG